MSGQLDDPRFDPANDEWVGSGARWDSVSPPGTTGRQGEVKFSQSTKAPPMTKDDVRLVFGVLDEGGLSMTYQKCVDVLRERGHEHLDLDHVALVAELSGIRGRTREWEKVPYPVRQLSTSLGERRKRRRTKRK